MKANQPFELKLTWDENGKLAVTYSEAIGRFMVDSEIFDSLEKVFNINKIIWEFTYGKHGCYIKDCLKEDSRERIYEAYLYEKSMNEISQRYYHDAMQWYMEGKYKIKELESLLAKKECSTCSANEKSE